MNKPASTLVIARYKEDLEWISDVPDHFRVVVYNKGPLIESLPALRRADVIERRPNTGRESETYLHHLRAHGDSDSEWTIFTQGDPFEHSPDFLELLKHQESWGPIQPLTIRWLDATDIPPRHLIESETGDWIKGCKIRKEIFSLHSLTALKFVDHGMDGHRSNYRRIYEVEPGENIVAHFLNLCGLPEIAGKATNVDFGKFCYGAIFAANRSRIPMLDPLALSQMIDLANGDGVHGYVFERLWLHFFGEPFLAL